ncbi:MAG: hypothetical protein LBB94_00625 [Clostridiales bacterium]|nr:hypothetical protein [Clostridiales bacterium]
MAAYCKTYGNTARDLEPTPVVSKKAEVKNKKRPAVMFVYRNDHKHKLSALAVATLILIFAGAAGTAASLANVRISERRIVSLNDDLRGMNSQIKNMREEAGRNADVALIMEAARGRLGMSEPKPYQILHINVPEENYVEYNQSKE